MPASTPTLPLVSVLVVTYNQKEFIRQALDSILMQRCNFAFEILIGEDCSTDGTREICLEYATQYPDIIVLELNSHNKGFLDNYFDLLAKTRGKYLADCGGDDFWLDENRLQQQVEYLENNPETGLIAGNWMILEDSTGVLKNATTPSVNNWFHPSHFGSAAVASYLNSSQLPKILLSASCFRADWAKEALLNHPGLFRGVDATCEDLPLTMSMLLRGPLHLSAKNWAVYRLRENSVSHSKNAYEWVKGYAFTTFRQTLNLARTYGVQPKELSTYLKKNSKDLALNAFLQDDLDFLIRQMEYLQSNAWPVPTKLIVLRFILKQRFLYKPCLQAYNRFKS